MRRQRIVGGPVSGWWLTAILIVGFTPGSEVPALGATAAPAETSLRDGAGWWIDTHGVVEPNDDPRAARAQKIFERVAMAADKKANRLPGLVVVNTAADPFAIALPDGTVVLTRGALDLCYGAPSAHAPAAGETLAELGDHRLAFVIGHELAHLSRDDFWHAAAFSAADKYASNAPAARQVRDELAPLPRDLRLLELQADSTGSLYMAMAGFSPGELLRRDPAFFARWAGQHDVERAYKDAAHPTPEQRAESLRSQLAAVVDALDEFDFGVRLAELGRYDDSILLLEQFKGRFASREVLSNLGYVHYQQALQLLARCDGTTVARFRLPVAVDDTTLAGRARLRGGAGSVCLGAEPVRQRLHEARRYLELASERDSGYLPARHLLLALELVSQRAAAAIALADDTLAIAPGDATARNAKGVALYLWGREMRTDLVDTALRVLREAETDPRRVADVVYNQAVIASERGRAAAARDAWQRFIVLEPYGVHAEIARQRLGLTEPAAASSSTAQPDVALRSPVALGPLGAETRAQLALMERQTLQIGALRGAIYRGPGLRVLLIGEAVEVVEQRVDQPLPNPTGQLPLAKVESPRGVLLRFAGHALDVEGDRVRAVVHFVPNGD